MTLKKLSVDEVVKHTENVVLKNYALFRQYPECFMDSIKAVFANSKFSRYQRSMLIIAVKTAAARMNMKLPQNRGVKSVRKATKNCKIRTVIYSAA